MPFITFFQFFNEKTPKNYNKDIPYILFRKSEHKKRENVLDWEITVPDRPTGALYSHPSLKIPILDHTDIAPPRFVFPPSEQDTEKPLFRMIFSEIFQLIFADFFRATRKVVACYSIP